MENYPPKGIRIEKTKDDSIIIRTDKRELVFSDYFALFFVFYGFTVLAFALIKTGFSQIPSLFYIAASLMLGAFFFSILISIKEVYLITITDTTIEIVNQIWKFKKRTIIDRNKISKIDFRRLNFYSNFGLSLLLMIKKSLSYGPYEIPRIIYGSESIYVLKNYKKEIRIWIANYLKVLIN
jgi:hypothetical protein